MINKSDSCDFIITRMITDRIGLHSVVLPVFIKLVVLEFIFSRHFSLLLSPVSALCTRINDTLLKFLGMMMITGTHLNLCNGPVV